MSDFKMKLEQFDEKLIFFFKTISIPMARISLFVVFFWFGVLKILYTSPANPLVAALLGKTLPFLSFGRFIVFFSLFEMLIGVLFLIPQMSRVVLPLLALHMLTTFLPLVFLRQITWQAFLIPTLEGQYIIKNLVIIALAIVIAANLDPLRYKKLNQNHNAYGS